MLGHWGKTAPMLLQTLAIFAGLSALAMWCADRFNNLWVLGIYFLALLAQAVLFERLYIIGHEAVHRKLVPHRPWLNDFLGQAMMLPILFPLVVYRKVHQQRKQEHASTWQRLVKIRAKLRQQTV